MQKFLKPFIVSVLTWEARLIVRRRKPFIVGVTGSVGKTTTKDAIFHVLNNAASIRKSEKSFNSEIGIPLTILDLPNAWNNPFLWFGYLCIGFWRTITSSDCPQLLVLEIGADHPGDISRVTTWLKPNIAVITRLPERPVHVEYFSSPEEVRKEKWELARALGEGGLLVISGDDPHLRALAATIKVRVITFGRGSENDVRSDDAAVYYEDNGNGTRFPVGTTFSVRWGDKDYSGSLKNVLGAQSVSAVLAALAVGVLRGESIERMMRTLETFQAPPGRMRIIRGKADSVIIDDSYNSSPIALEAALATLADIEGKRKIALLGDMLELGKFSEEEHRKMGRIAAGIVDQLLLVGKRARWMAEGARAAGLAQEKIHHFTDSILAGKQMVEQLRQGDVILVKGSQGSGENMIRMERAVKLLMAEPEDAPKLLVRQEKEWQRQYTQ